MMVLKRSLRSDDNREVVREAYWVCHKTGAQPDCVI